MEVVFKKFQKYSKSLKEIRKKFKYFSVPEKNFEKIQKFSWGSKKFLKFKKNS